MPTNKESNILDNYITRSVDTEKFHIKYYQHSCGRSHMWKASTNTLPKGIVKDAS